MSQTHKLPSAFVNRIEQLFPSLAPAIFRAASFSPVTTFRINRLKVNPHAWHAMMHEERIRARQVSWFHDAYILTNMEQRELQETASYKEGRIYLQNISSMMPVIVLDPGPHETILDLCAAPGSKTTQIASVTGNQAAIIAVEKIKPRFFRLKANLALQGATSVEALLNDGSFMHRTYPAHFDRVLVDAPCSAEGLFRTYDERSFGYWSPRKVKEMQHKQRRLIFAGWQALKSGGVMVYSTCTYSPEENEEVVSWLIKKFPGEVTVEPIALPFANYSAGITAATEKVFDPQMKNTRRIIPTETMEGFFIAKLRKR